jgi:isopentenyl diphosphate isomerase/L-lactate dehydrogenase-like FMN-dependent dehydrogenase
MRLEPMNLYELEAHAERFISPHAWAFIVGGAQDEITVRRNRSAFEAITLRPRFLEDIADRDLSTTVLGEQISFPVMVAPAGGHQFAHPDGELATAKGAGAAGTLMVLASGSHYSMEQVAEAATGPLWFQLYHRGKEITEMLVHRAEQAGYKAVCVTVDTPISSPIERSARHGSERPRGFNPGNFVGEEAGMGLLPDTLDALYWNAPPTIPLTWTELAWLRSVTSLPLVLKGIRTAEDAFKAVEHGIDGILVSNHGARQLDGTLATIEMLPEIVEVVNGRSEIYLDSGIRRGSDVIKALALGARAVLVGRPLYWGLAWNGAEGVRLVLEILRHEVDLVLGHCGHTSVQTLDASLVNLPA